MDISLYRQYLDEYIQEAIDESDGSNRGIINHLRDKQIGRFLVRHREIKRRALDDAIRAFEEHAHWPQDIILSHLGVNVKTK
jgi:hypothetical protein